MKKLIGIHDKNLIVQENSNIFIEKSACKDYINKDLILNRDKIIKDPLSDEIDGDGVFNFRYGPITAGVGEAGVYNLYTYGERILYVSMDTSYKRRNIEDLLIEKNIYEGLDISKRVCGNFLVSHSLSFSRAIENALKIEVNDNTKRLRTVSLELERIYNHIYVISRLASAAAQQVLASHLQGLFEESLVNNKIFCNSRYLQDTINIGNKVEIIDKQRIIKIKERLKNLKKEFKELFKHSMTSGNYIDRLHSTATISLKDASLIGLTGPSLRACGTDEDLRKKEDLYKEIETIKSENGDSLSRMEVRAKETIQSIEFVQREIDKIENCSDDTEIVNNDGRGIGFCESPSGSVVYDIEVQNKKIISIYISTPSVFGLAAIGHSIVGNIFTDFPFAVESFGINFADASR